MAQDSAGHRSFQGYGRVRGRSRLVTAARAGGMGVVVVAATLVVVTGGVVTGVVVLDVWSMTCRLSVIITMKATKMAAEVMPRLNEQSPRAESCRGTL